MAENKTGRMQKKIPVRNILQNPELPTGCECVSLTILLGHLGRQALTIRLGTVYD